MQQIIMLGNYKIKLLDVFMIIWGVVVLELDSHPDHNKGTDPRNLTAGPKTHPVDH